MKTAERPSLSAPLKPRTLRPGDTIGVMAPGGYVENAVLESARACVESCGYRVRIHPQSTARHGQSAGTDAEKRAALDALLADETVRAIVPARGGNRTLAFLDHIDWAACAAARKIVMGFSDTTALLNALYARAGLTSFHGPLFMSFPQQAEAGTLPCTFALLAGKTPVWPMEQARILRPGTAEGPMIGGNLSVFHLLPGTAYMPPCAGAILFLEDIGDELSRIDRMLIHLKQTGVFETISGLILGGFTDMQDTGRHPFGFTLEECVLEHAAPYGFPIVADAPFGHSGPLYPLPVGSRARLEATGGRIALSFIEPAVET